MWSSHLAEGPLQVSGSWYEVSYLGLIHPLPLPRERVYRATKHFLRLVLLPLYLPRMEGWPLLLSTCLCWWKSGKEAFGILAHHFSKMANLWFKIAFLVFNSKTKRLFLNQIFRTSGVFSEGNQWSYLAVNLKTKTFSSQSITWLTSSTGGKNHKTMLLQWHEQKLINSFKFYCTCQRLRKQNIVFREEEVGGDCGNFERNYWVFSRALKVETASSL